MRDSIRTVECIVRDHPELTGKEVLALHEQDKKEHEEYLIKKQQDKYDWVTDINTNGGYFRGKFGLCQRYYYKVSDVKLDKNTGRLWGNVEKLVAFHDDGSGRGTMKNGEFRVELEKDEYTELTDYHLSLEDRVTKQDWEKLIEYMNAMTKLFW